MFIFAGMCFPTKCCKDRINGKPGFAWQLLKTMHGRREVLIATLT
jgi:hypothetical protein